jgi:hypothetical protein
LEAQVLQAVGKVAGIGGLALGVFLLLFREVIRKNIFPTLSDDHAYRLIRQFMSLTFAVAISGVVAWTYVAAAATASGQSRAKDVAPPVELARAPSVPAADLAGTWKASVTYDWGDTYQERFEFVVNGNELSGSASYVTGEHGLLEGKIDGNRLTFQTVSYSELNDQRYQEKHRYSGTVSGDAIEFVLNTDSGYDSPPPTKFTAHRDRTK